MKDRLVLYQDPYCPFCRRVTDFLEESNHVLPMRDIMRDRDAYEELIRGGGRGTVPCLRITLEDGKHKWMYESLDILDFLRKEI